MFESELFGDDIKKVLPVINTDGSDSAMFDNCLELLRPGRPRAAARHDDDDSRAVGKSREHERRRSGRSTNIIPACMEPWDGPASIAFTDGVRIGACLDRNGLRPSRYYVTKDDLVIMASRSRRAGHRARAGRAERAVCSRAACSWWTPSRAASSRTRN